MIAADRARQRPPDARLLAVVADGGMQHVSRPDLEQFLRAGDLLVANDAATLPASLRGRHDRTGSAIEIRLAGWQSRDALDVSRFSAVVFGEGDYHTRTEDRPPPPALLVGDRVTLGPLTATISEILGHQRLVSVTFDGSAGQIWAGLAHHGRAIQYAYIEQPLELWDVWTSFAARPVAFEPPSAGFALDWRLIARLRAHGIHFATITHAAGISSTGDLELDRRLPLDELYEISETAATAIAGARRRGGRIIAIGTTVVRALEHAASRDGVVHAGRGLADQRIGSHTSLRVVDAILSGTHEPGTSHYELLRAFIEDQRLHEADSELESHCYRTHEFGDSIFVERQSGSQRIL
jgi:S-adenosylmethionine:tRNA ribosyltransferase-isomerase